MDGVQQWSTQYQFHIAFQPFGFHAFPWSIVQHKTNLYWYTWMLTHLKYLLMELRLHNNYLQFYNLLWWKKLDLNPFMCKLFIRNQFKWIAFSTWSSRYIPISKWNYFSNTLDESLLIERNGYSWRGAPLLWRDRVPTTPLEDAKGERQIDIICNRSRWKPVEIPNPWQAHC